MSDKMSLQDIFNDDPYNLLNIKPSSPARNEDERLIASFQEITDFYENNSREPELDGGIQEHQLCSRLESLRTNPLKMEILKAHDKFGLLNSERQQINSLNDILNDDSLGLLDDDSEGLFDLKHINKTDERASADFVARRTPCKNFTKYEALFKEVQNDLKIGKRKIIGFKQGNLKEGAFYIHNGILFLIEKINISQKEHYKKDGTRVREDGRTRCIFENGTESNMLKRSIEKILYANGQVVSENIDKDNEAFNEKFGNITEEDKESGFIYILKSKSDKKEIREINNLYKIGFSTVPIEERIRKATQEPTYLMASVKIVRAYKCFNMNTQKLELLLHNFFGSSCLNIDIYDNLGNRHTPREWFIAPLDIIEQAIHLIISGDIIKYRYDSINEEVIMR